MKKSMLIGVVVGIIVLVIAGYFIIKGSIEIDGECEIENPDSDGYLLKICQYLREHEDTVFPNKEPDDYLINSIEDGEYMGMGTNVIVIRLDCCGTGDLANIDKETKEVIGFSPGDW